MTNIPATPVPPSHIPLHAQIPQEKRKKKKKGETSTIQFSITIKPLDVFSWKINGSWLPLKLIFGLWQLDQVGPPNLYVGIEVCDSLFLKILEWFPSDGKHSHWMRMDRIVSPIPNFYFPILLSLPPQYVVERLISCHDYSYRTHWNHSSQRHVKQAEQIPTSRKSLFHSK